MNSQQKKPQISIITMFKNGIKVYLQSKSKTELVYVVEMLL